MLSTEVLKMCTVDMVSKEQRFKRRQLNYCDSTNSDTQLFW